MRMFPALLFLLLGEVIAPARPPAPAYETVELFGHAYIRLQDWAHANGFAVKWPAQSKDVELARQGTRLLFTIDSRRAEINHVTVWLSVPVAQRNGAIYFSPLDLKTLIAPILSPTKNPPNTRIKTICLDAGHGGKDPGNQVGAHQEKSYTLLLAKEVRDLLGRAGFRVAMTRSGDAYPERSQRPEIARRARADLFVSLHYNSLTGDGSGTRGVETFCLTPAGATSTNARGEASDTRAVLGNLSNARSTLLAYQIQKSLVLRLGMEDRGLKRARFEIFRTAEMPAVLVECGFMSDPAEAQRIFDLTFRRRMAQAIVDGLIAYRNRVEGR
ncbi:MAG: N-acetylmuramoyl-L-alanine amidase [Verrucomicrobia bacterium]|nr:N-acetylmuramoyl-L-alanine amidase [Verrucomicrobiota bacterium]